MKKVTLPISVAVIGLGRAGWIMHLKPLFKHGGFRIDAVADPVPERREEAVALTGCKAFDSLDALLRGTDAQLVVVATPSFAHADEALKVLRAGRHCILEKPMALNYRDARQIADEAEERNLGLFVHHTQLHLPEYWHLKAVLESGVLGKVFHFRVFWGSYRRRWDWQTLKKNGGGHMNNACSHALSVLLPLMPGPARAVYCNLRNIKDAGDTEDHVHVVLETECGTTADVVVSSAVGVKVPRWILCGEYGTLISDGVKSRVRYHDPATLPPLAVLDAAAPGRQYTKDDLSWTEEEIEVEAAPVPLFHDNVFEALTKGAPLTVTPEGAVEVIRVIDEARGKASSELAAIMA